MIVENISLTKRMTVTLDNDEINLLIDLLKDALNGNGMTNSHDDIAHTMLNALSKMTADA